MHIHGYTDDKAVVRVNLTIEEIASRHLDPWRLDLFDAAPVKLTVQTESGEAVALNFRRLTDISFSYVRRRRLFVCRDDGVDQVCLSVDPHTKRGVQISRLSFAEHYEYYLLLFSEIGKIQADGLSPISPQPASALGIAGDSVTFSARHDVCLSRGPDSEPVYVGESLCRVALPTPLPESINWVLDVLAEAKPCITGVQLSKAIAGVQPHFVRIYVGENVTHACELIERAGVKLSERTLVAGEFNHLGCKYALSMRTDPSVGEGILSLATGYVNTKLRSYRPNEVRGTRLQFLEHAQQQVRFADRLKVGPGPVLIFIDEMDTIKSKPRRRKRRTGTVPKGKPQRRLA